MPYVQMKLTGISTKSWVDKATGASKSILLLEGRVNVPESFSIDSAMEARYRSLIGKEVLVPYTERAKAGGGMYRQLDADLFPIPVSPVAGGTKS